MHEIIFYQDRNGRQPVLDYMEKLGKSKSKDSRIKLNKISDYIQALSVYGTEQLTENYVKHLDGEIWELRPIRCCREWPLCATPPIHEKDTKNTCARDRAGKTGTG